MAKLKVNEDAQTYTIFESGKKPLVLDVSYTDYAGFDQMCYEINLLEGSTAEGYFYSDCILQGDPGGEVLIDLNKGFSACSDHGSMSARQAA